MHVPIPTLLSSLFHILFFTLFRPCGVSLQLLSSAAMTYFFYFPIYYYEMPALIRLVVVVLHLGERRSWNDGDALSNALKAGKLIAFTRSLRTSRNTK